MVSVQVKIMEIWQWLIDWGWIAVAILFYFIGRYM